MLEFLVMWRCRRGLLCYNGLVGMVFFRLMLVLECYYLNKLVLLVDGVGPVVLAGRFLRGGMMLGASDFLVLRSNKVCICVDSCC